MAVLAYANDVVLINKSHKGLKSLFSRLKEIAKNIGLQVNKNKTESMVIGRRHNVEMFSSLNVDDFEFSRGK